MVSRWIRMCPDIISQDLYFLSRPGPIHIGIARLVEERNLMGYFAKRRTR